MSDSSASSRWKASLAVCLEDRHERSVLTHLAHRGPLRIQRPFYPEDGLCHLYFLHPPGGIVGGDNLSFDVVVKEYAKTLITAPGASKVYRSKGPVSEIEQVFRVNNHASLEWLPPGTIFFPSAKAKISSNYHLASDARLISCETLCFGRPVMHEYFDEGEVTASLNVTLDGAPLLNEVLRIDAGREVLGQYSLHSTLLIYPANDALLKQVRDVLAEYAEPAGATLLDKLMVVRLLASENVALDKTIVRIWEAAREEIIGYPPVPPRIWAT